jgi:hypothetical protein
MAEPSDRLPHVDEHSTEVGASPEVVWEALLKVVEGSFRSGATARFARLLACEDLEASGPRPLATESSFPGFHVEQATPPDELALRGGHRFSQYALTFRLDELGPERTRLRAETRASFPGLHGRAYRALVIDTRLHVLVTRRILNAVRRRAERGAGWVPPRSGPLGLS